MLISFLFSFFLFIHRTHNTPSTQQTKRYLSVTDCAPPRPRRTRTPRGKVYHGPPATSKGQASPSSSGDREPIRGRRDARLWLIAPVLEIDRDSTRHPSHLYSTLRSSTRGGPRLDPQDYVTSSMGGHVALRPLCPLNPSTIRGRVGITVGNISWKSSQHVRGKVLDLLHQQKKKRKKKNNSTHGE